MADKGLLCVTPSPRDARYKLIALTAEGEELYETMQHNCTNFGDRLLEHIPAHVTASNVAPQYGTEETRAYLKLCATEQILVDNGLCDDPSDLYHTLLVKAIKTERWRKWMTGDDVNLQVDDILADDELSLKILDVSGHYAFNDPEVKEQVEKLYRNLAAQDIDGKRFVIEHIKRPIKQYVVGLNLKASRAASRRLSRTK